MSECCHCERSEAIPHTEDGERRAEDGMRRTDCGQRTTDSGERIVDYGGRTRIPISGRGCPISLFGIGNSPTLQRGVLKDYNQAVLTTLVVSQVIREMTFLHSPIQPPTSNFRYRWHPCRPIIAEIASSRPQTGTRSRQ